MPNSAASVVDCALPGALPTLNEECVRQAIRAGAGLHGDVQLRSMFERKHYFYCDLPQGYQITQQDLPIVVGGHLYIGNWVDPAHPTPAVVNITRIQLEQDSGKSIHDIHPTRTHVDLNRAGTALLEIVSEPDMRSAAEACAFLSKMQNLLRHLDICSGSMEDGSMRCDVNISVRRIGETEYGERVEVKNMNSVRSLGRAVEYEMLRQIAILEEGSDVDEVARETRGFDASTGKTVRMRSKEQLLDYRFLPDPDLPVVELDRGFVDDIIKNLPELPDEVAARWKETFGLSDYDCGVLLNDSLSVAFLDELVTGNASPSTTPDIKRPPKKCVNWLCNEVMGRLSAKNFDLRACPVSVSQVASLVDAVEDGSISGKQGKVVLDLMMDGNSKSAYEIAEDEGWKQVSSEGALIALIDDVFVQYQGEVESFVESGGKNKRVVGFFIGQILKASNGTANPKVVAKLVNQHLRSLMK